MDFAPDDITKCRRIGPHSSDLFGDSMRIAGERNGVLVAVGSKPLTFDGDGTAHRKKQRQCPTQQADFGSKKLGMQDKSPHSGDAATIRTLPIGPSPVHNARTRFTCSGVWNSRWSGGHPTRRPRCSARAGRQCERMRCAVRYGQGIERRNFQGEPPSHVPKPSAKK